MSKFLEDCCDTWKTAERAAEVSETLGIFDREETYIIANWARSLGHALAPLNWWPQEGEPH